MQMAPTKHATTKPTASKKQSSKRARTNSDNFRSTEAGLKYTDCYKDNNNHGRVVQLDTLQETFILDVFKERTWTKLLNPSGIVYDEIIREFFSNATIERNEINCWVRQKEFVITRQDIQDFLEVRPPSQLITTQYENRIGAIGEMIQILGGTPTKQSMNTLKFTPEMKALAHIMLHNLYLVTNLTTLSAARTRFLFGLFTHKEIDICGHIFHILKKSIAKQTTRIVMPFPTLIMGLIANTWLKISSGLKVVPRDYPIGGHTIVRSLAHIKKSKTGVPPMPQALVEEEGGDTEDEIDRFTTALEPLDQPSAQPSSSAPPKGPDRLDCSLAKIDQMSTVLDSHV